MMRLVWLETNQAYTFVFGEDLLRMSDEPMFFYSWDDALEAARRHELTIEKSGRVRAIHKGGLSMASSSRQSPRFMRNVPKPTRGVCERCTKLDATHYFSMFFSHDSDYAGDPGHAGAGEIIHARVCDRCRKMLIKLKKKHKSQFKRLT